MSEREPEPRDGKLRGRLVYARWAKCIADAPTVADAGRC